jgi:hypothetical protein
MDFGKPKLDFEEADRRYALLKGRHEAGEITEEEFDEQLKRLIIQDEEGCWWSKSRKSGQWHYHDGRTWVRGTPAYHAPAPGAVRNIRRGWLRNLTLKADVALVRRYILVFIVAFLATFIVGVAVIATVAVLEALQTGGSPCLSVGTTEWCLWS